MAIFSALFSIQNSNNLVRNVLRFHLGRFGHHQQFNVHIANNNTVFIFMDCPAYVVGPVLFVHLLLLKCSTFEMGHRIRPVHTSLQIFSACNRQSLCEIGEFSSFFVLNALQHYKFAATSDWLVWSLNHRHLIKRTEYSFWKCSLNSFSLRESANELESLHWIWISRSNLLIHL